MICEIFEGARIIYEGGYKYNNKAYVGKTGTVAWIRDNQAGIHWDHRPNDSPIIHWIPNLKLANSVDVGDLEDDL